MSSERTSNLVPISDVVADIDLRFTSGNSIPVERAHIKADEWRTIKYALCACNSADETTDDMRVLRGIVNNQAADRESLTVSMALLRRIVRAQEPPSNEEVESLRVQLAEWQRWTKGHVWIRSEEYAELCELKRLHGPKPTSLPDETCGDVWPGSMHAVCKLTKGHDGDHRGGYPYSWNRVPEEPKQSQCNSPCPAHICVEMSKSGMCSVKAAALSEAEQLLQAWFDRW